MIAVVFQTESSLSGPFLRVLEEFLNSVLAEHDLGESEVSLVFCSDGFIAEMNKQYRGKRGPTDVLSFSLREGEDMTAGMDEEDGAYESLGDIIISLDRAAVQAKEYEVAFEEEIARLAIHGLLHLLGYDHGESDTEGEMFVLQDEYLARFMKIFCH